MDKNTEAQTTEATRKWRDSYGITDDALIEAQATSAFGTYNPVAIVKCPHCGTTLQAIDAKKHVRTAAGYATI